MNTIPPIIDASKPGVLDLGEIVIFSLGNNAYAVSAPAGHEHWEVHFRKAFNVLFPGSALMTVYRLDGESPSFTALSESVHLRQMIEGIVLEILGKVLKSSQDSFFDELRKMMK